jgi:SAM-dependent methyltransferase
MAAIRVNAGCGTSAIPGWRNYDNSFSVKLANAPRLQGILTRLGIITGPNIDLIESARRNGVEYADVSKRIPLPEKSVDLLYTCHMLEHLDRQDARVFLREAHRVLRPGGTLRVVVPDIAHKVAEYLEHKDADQFIEATLMCQPRPRTFGQRVRFFFTGPRHHNWMYDGASLSKLLGANGFTSAKILPPGETTCDDVGALDLYERSDESVYVEARAA